MKNTLFLNLALIAVELASVGQGVAQTLPSPVTVISSYPPPAPNAFLTNMRFGPDGLIYAWDGQHVWRQSGVNVDGFDTPAFGTVPSNGSDAGPINFSQNGQTIIVGNGSGGQDFSGASSGLLYTMPAAGGSAGLAGTVPFHQDLVPPPAAATMSGAAVKFLVDRGSADFATSEIDLFDFATGAMAPLIRNIPGASSSIAFDSENRLCVGIGFGSSRGQVRRFTLPLVDLAASGQPLDWTTGQLFNTVDNNSGAGMFFDARGNLFVGGPNGATVFNANGASQFYSTGASSFPIVMYNATNDQFALTLNGFNDPMNLGFSPRIYRASELFVPTPPLNSWKADAGGNWSDDGNWDSAVAPNGIDSRAALGPVAAVPQTVALNSPITLGNLTFGGSQSYRVAGTGPLTMQVSTTIATIQVAGGTHEIAAPLVLGSDTEVTVSGSSDGVTLSGGVSGPGMLSKEGAGTLTITGPNTYAGNTAVDGGTLRFNVANGKTIVDSSAVVTVAPGATLELAGSISALGATAGPRARIVNDSIGSGLLVSGQNQIVGNIDGAGQTTITAGSDLTASHIIQSALIVEGSPAGLATMTIAAADESGAPLPTDAIGSLISKPQIGAVPTAPLTGDLVDATSRSIGLHNGCLAAGESVPEPSAEVQGLLIVGMLAILSRKRRARVLARRAFKIRSC